MVRKTIEENHGERCGVIPRVARQLGVGAESLRSWVIQGEVDGETRDGLSTEERARMSELERDVRELRPNDLAISTGRRSELRELLRRCHIPRILRGRPLRLRLDPA